MKNFLGLCLTLFGILILFLVSLAIPGMIQIYLSIVGLAVCGFMIFSVIWFFLMIGLICGIIYSLLTGKYLRDMKED